MYIPAFHAMIRRKNIRKKQAGPGKKRLLFLRPRRSSYTYLYIKETP
jgi:hypothetical protein